MPSGNLAKDIDYKAQALQQWTETPCGSLDDPTLIPGSRDYFAAVDYDRYVRYAPWLSPKIDFPRFRNADVIEVGYGQGTDLVQFAKAGARSVSGLDLSPSHKALAQDRFDLAGFPVSLFLHDAESRWPFNDGSADLVYSFGVLHHTPHPERVLSEAYRVLRPGGTILLGLYHRRSLFALQRLFSWARHCEWRTESYSQSFWRIEAHAPATTARTLVNRYTRRDMRNILSAFTQSNVSVEHLGVDDSRYFRWLSPGMRAWLARRWGWYVFGEAKKPTVSRSR